MSIPNLVNTSWRPDQGPMEIPVRIELQKMGIEVKSDEPIQLLLTDPDTGKQMFTIPDGQVAKSRLSKFWQPYYLHGEAHRGKRLDRDNLILEQLRVLGYPKPLIIKHGASTQAKARRAAIIIAAHLDGMLTPTIIDLEREIQP